FATNPGVFDDHSALDPIITTVRGTETQPPALPCREATPTGFVLIILINNELLNCMTVIYVMSSAYLLLFIPIWDPASVRVRGQIP
ncbi:hypothetical protein, partial [Klebsiella pneumoniae]|uniref:hypothetical protein n=1 Tax=Klebsiella pneumoniae TaxID=573 RepID=UPI001C6F70C0